MSLVTKYGSIPDLAVPRIRKGEIKFKPLEKYKRRAPHIDTTIGKLFVSGVSTRKLESILGELFEDTVEFLFLDGMSQKVRELGIENKVMLCA